MTNVNKDSRGTVATLRALLDKATPGPWREDYKERPDFGEEQYIVAPPGSFETEHGRESTVVVGTGWYDGMHLALREADANLIIALRNAAPALLDRIEALEKVLRDISTVETGAADTDALRMMQLALDALEVGLPMTDYNQKKDTRDPIWGTVREEELAATYRERDALAVSWEEAKAERDALRAEVERLRAAMNRAHGSILLALQVREDIELRGALEEIEAALSSAPPAKTGPACEKCRGYGMKWRSGVLVDCECHFPRVDEPAKPSAPVCEHGARISGGLCMSCLANAKPSALDEALAAWRGLSVAQSASCIWLVEANCALPGIGGVSAEVKAALALLRAAAARPSAVDERQAADTATMLGRALGAAHRLRRFMNAYFTEDNITEEAGNVLGETAWIEGGR